MSTWIKLENSIWENSKVEFISMECEIPLEMVVGMITRIWSWFDQHSFDGTTDRFGTAKINKIIVTSVTQLRDINATSVTNNFIKCLKEVDWYHINEDKTSFLPKWEAHNGATAKKRATDQKRQESHRKQGDAKQKTKKATSVTQDRDELATREEKRREEKKELSNDNSHIACAHENLPAQPTMTKEQAYQISHSHIPEKEQFVNHGLMHWGHKGLSREEWEEIFAGYEASGWRKNNGQAIHNWKSDMQYSAQRLVESRAKMQSTQKITEARVATASKTKRSALDYDSNAQRDVFERALALHEARMA